MLSPNRGLSLPHRRTLLLALVLFPSLFMWLYNIIPAIIHLVQRRQQLFSLPNPLIEFAEYPYSLDSNISVNLVIATQQTDDISWTERLKIPNLNIIRYVSDDPYAPFHPPVAKGREALMYHTYFHDFYDDLPDISILVHAHEDPWHIDKELHSSMTFTLSRLDLDEVLRRGYANLRVSWKGACPNWINTTKSEEESVKQEEPYMATAFRANFGDDVRVPEILAGPCCSQFAVTRDAIRRRPREQYARNMQWLIETDWTDYIAGRTWEHMWPWLFKEEATDCPVEWKTYCRMYGVCFAGMGEWLQFEALILEKEELQRRQTFFQELWEPEAAEYGRRRIRVIDHVVAGSIRDAVERGDNPTLRGEAMGDLYVQ